MQASDAKSQNTLGEITDQGSLDRKSLIESNKGTEEPQIEIQDADSIGLNSDDDNDDAKSHIHDKRGKKT